MAFPNRHRLHPVTTFFFDTIRSKYVHELSKQGLTSYAVAKRLQSKGHKITRQGLYQFAKGSWYPPYVFLADIFLELGLRFPEDVIDFKR
jgi:hypothetical protein